MSQDVAETIPALVLELDGDRQEFRASASANQFLLVKYADDLGSGGFGTARALTRLCLGQVLKDERARLETYLEDHGTSDEYVNGLDNGLSACWSGETMLPLASSSDSPAPTSPTPAPDSESTDDSPSPEIEENTWPD